MTLEAKITTKENKPTPADWERLRSRLKDVKSAHKKFVKQIPGYRNRKVDCIYEHFYVNGILDVDILLKGRSEALSAEAYRECLETLTHKLKDTIDYLKKT